MKFEEALKIMREGGKARCKSYDKEGQYWICGTAGIKGVSQEYNFSTIHRVSKDGKSIIDKDGWAICRWAIMCEDWEEVNVT